MTVFDYQVHVTVHRRGAPKEARLRMFVGSVKSTEELDPKQLGTAATIDALQDSAEKVLEGAGRVPADV